MSRGGCSHSAAATNATGHADDANATGHADDATPFPPAGDGTCSSDATSPASRESAPAWLGHGTNGSLTGVSSTTAAVSDGRCGDVYALPKHASSKSISPGAVVGGMTHTVHKCLLMSGEASSALSYAQSGGSHPTTWIVDTGAGVSMAWDRSKFKPGTLVAFKVGSAQVGSGALCPATHRGMIVSALPRARFLTLD